MAAAHDETGAFAQRVSSVYRGIINIITSPGINGVVYGPTCMRAILCPDDACPFMNTDSVIKAYIPRPASTGDLCTQIILNVRDIKLSRFSAPDSSHALGGPAGSCYVTLKKDGGFKHRVHVHIIDSMLRHVVDPTLDVDFLAYNGRAMYTLPPAGGCPRHDVPTLIRQVLNRKFKLHIPRGSTPGDVSNTLREALALLLDGWAHSPSSNSPSIHLALSSQALTTPSEHCTICFELLHHQGSHQEITAVAPDEEQCRKPFHNHRAIGFVQLPCGHVFHGLCGSGSGEGGICQWFRASKTLSCPVCRQDVI